MAKIRNFSKRAQKTRERVRNWRQRNTNKKIHEERVAQMITNAPTSNFNDSNTSQTLNNGVFGGNDSDISYENTDRDEFVQISFDIRGKLRFWAAKHRISHLAINDLLSILNCTGFNFLPKDSRTLMQTPTAVEIASLENGKLWYRGIRTCLNDVLSKRNRDTVITLDFNFDGMPLFNSSKLQFWPILSAIQGSIIYSIYK